MASFCRDHPSRKLRRTGSIRSCVSLDNPVLCSPPRFVFMPVDQDRTRFVFQKLSRQLARLADKPQPDNVHLFRTYARRVQALLEELTPDLGRNQKKLLKLLAKLRRRAGRVRDLDVQIAALRSLKIPQEPARKTQVLRTLVEMRAKREKKLLKALDDETVRDLRKRLKRAPSRVQIPSEVDPLAAASRAFAKLSRDSTPLSEEVLHQYRIAGKRVRYVAELAAKTAEADRMLQELKHMQDGLGDWHDWLMLTQSAEKLFGGVQDSALVAALRNVTQAKFRHAVQVVTQTRAALQGKPAGSRLGPEAVGAAARRKPAAATEKLTAAIA